MAKYNQIRYGSTGEDVKKLQEFMNQNGYQMDTDGIFDSKTESAVKDYQRKNGLSEDGIVGDNTWSKLYGSETATDNTQQSATEEKTTGFQYDPYQKSDAVTQAERLLQEHMDKKPGSYQSNWQSQIDDILNRILNREDFSYDMNQDAFFQQAANLYKLQGQQAMMDTVGQAAAMTGGYGNTYAQGAGQQAYQGYLQQINNMLPEFRQQALDLYNLEGQRMSDNLSMMIGMEEQDYGRWNDENSRYMEELQRLSDEAKYLEESDYARWANERDFQYGQHRDNTSDEQWNKEYDFALRQYEDAKIDSASTGGDGSDGNGYKAPDGWDEGDVAAFQEKYGLENDGIFGPKTEEVYNLISELNAIVAGEETGEDAEKKGADNKNSSKESDVKAWLREALQAGDISQETYNILLNEFAPKGQKY